jgi:hypothetical protein
MTDAEQQKDPQIDELDSDTLNENLEEKTNDAVADIVRTEADDELKSQDEAAKQAVVMKIGLWGRFKNFQSEWWHSPLKAWGTVIVLVILLGALFGVSVIRDDILGLFLSEKITVQTIDSKDSAGVSGVKVQIGSVSAETNASGKAVLTVHTGHRTLLVSKKYYAGTSQSILVGLSPASNVYKAKIVALGRQVKVGVINSITRSPLANAEISAGGANAKTNANGEAIVVLPSGAISQSAAISLNGYNVANQAITADGSLTQNTFSVTPAGKIYFLSNLSGTIDVVKTNLDGTDRQTVLAGTGSEDPSTTSLLASRDWKYLALLSKRSGSNASLYLIDTTNNDKLTTIDQGDATFSLVGWSGDKFVYEVDRSNTISDWQSNQEALKSFDPTTGQMLLLDQTQASGTGPPSEAYAKQAIGGAYLVGNNIVYAKNWQGDGQGGPGGVLGGKQAELDIISADGSMHRTVKSFTPASYSSAGWDGNQNISISLQSSKPNEIYISFYDGDQTTYYSFDNGSVTADASLNDAKFYQSPYTTYLLSPSGNQTFWTELRDGKNTLFIGDANGGGQKQIASLSDYSPYGWYSDNYLLVSKNGSELYAMPVAGGTPLKITDYYKPAVNYNGYGGGYGGL